MIIHGTPLSMLIRRVHKEKGHDYTEHEQKIINGEYLETLRRQDITKLIAKAERKNDINTARELNAMYHDLLYDDNYYLPRDIEIINGRINNPKPNDISRALHKARRKKDKMAVIQLRNLYNIPFDVIYKDYTDYERKIIAGSLENPPAAGDVTRVMEKALRFEDNDIARRVSDRYDDVINPIKERKYTLEESVERLHKLTKEYEETHKP